MDVDKKLKDLKEAEHRAKGSLWFLGGLALGAGLIACLALGLWRLFDSSLNAADASAVPIASAIQVVQVTAAGYEGTIQALESSILANEAVMETEVALAVANAIEHAGQSSASPASLIPGNATESPIQSATIPPTSTPLPTHTAVPTQTPVPLITLPFIDTFDAGLGSEWTKLSGQELIDQGQLTTVSDNLILQLNGRLPENFRIDFDYPEVRYLTISLGDHIQLDTTAPFWAEWQAFIDGRWEELAEVQMRSGHWTIEVRGNNYRLYEDYDLQHETMFGDPATGPLQISLDSSTRIDNFQVTAP